MRRLILKKNILIIEDDANTRELLRAALKDERLDFFEAENGSDGLEVLDNEEIDLILLDIQMPKMGGLEFLEIFSKKEKFKKIPVIVITAHVTSDIFHKSLEFNCYSYIVKPINSEKLKETILLALKIT